jgi:hypothetical protein
MPRMRGSQIRALDRDPSHALTLAPVVVVEMFGWLRFNHLVTRRHIATGVACGHNLVMCSKMIASMHILVGLHIRAWVSQVVATLLKHPRIVL